MANDTVSKLPSATLPADYQARVDSQKEAATKDKSKAVAGKEDFLNLLVHQLQNQDPLDPMKSEEFAVQLATFSQLEQLIQINEKMGGTGAAGTGSVGNMASFLGQQVVLKDEPIEIKGGKGPNILVDMPNGTLGARVDLMDSDGKVVASQTLDEGLEPGKQVLGLKGVNVANGSYDVRVVAVNASGQFQDLKARVTGVVDGFVLEPSPALLVGGNQVAMDRVAEVFRTEKSGS